MHTMHLGTFLLRSQMACGTLLPLALAFRLLEHSGCAFGGHDGNVADTGLSPVEALSRESSQEEPMVRAFFGPAPNESLCIPP
mmetsp:Transcript_20426/g.47905  ORF Transcript_20426/g.47905 Transcript_20426/m.47905 type:complete len:83 (+) Transcript_20426:552-800(+)